LSRRKPPIPFFTDNDIPDSVGEFLKDSGHDLTRLRDVMLTTSADPIVATACRESQLVLVTHNIKDFRKIAKDYEITKKEADGLCRVEMGCDQVRARERIEEALDVVEAEWRRLGRTKSGLIIHIGNSFIRIYR